MSIPRGLKCPGRFPAGEAWAALDSEQRVLYVISQDVRQTLTFSAYETFKKNARRTLAALGKVVQGDVIYEGGRCYFVPFDSRAEAHEKRFVQVDLKGDWKAYQATALDGWTFIGTATVDGVTGALAKATTGDTFAHIRNGIMTVLAADNVKAALHQAAAAATGPAAGYFPCAHAFPAGLYWAAMKDNRIVAVVPRPGKDAPDFEQIRANALDALAPQGTVLRGKVVKNGTGATFVKAKG